MKIVPIFAPYLHSLKFEGESDELNKLIDLWTDKEHLYDYFKIYDEVIKYEQINLEIAIKQTIKTIMSLQEGQSNNHKRWRIIFLPDRN